MFIAFEGPDNTGKSTSANNLSYRGEAIYNATKEQHTAMQMLENDLVVTYDRIDWFTHMVYRLGMPYKDWNDERPRTVFAMPDTHLVVKIHAPELAPLIDDELYETGKLAEVNPMYYWFADFFQSLNRQREYALFRSVSMIEVRNDPRDGTFSQRLASFDSASVAWAGEEITEDGELVDFLRYVDAHTI